VRYKVTILACEGLEKESIETGFLTRIDQEDFLITLRIDLPVKPVKTKADLQFWTFTFKELLDISNEEEFVLTKIKGSNGLVLIYDIANNQTLEWAFQKIQKVKEHLNPSPPILLLGNKSNLEESRSLSKEHISKLTDSQDIYSSLEISLNTGENVEEAFLELTKMMLVSSKPDYRIETDKIRVKKLAVLKQYKYAFLVLLFMLLISILGSVIMYFVL
jgi:GTPase SAR1 family protein